ncbi:MAG: hypothetical protein ACRC2R_16860 [Xenococcaceae cyanobacterium]
MARRFAYVNFRMVGAAGGYIADRGKMVDYTGRFVMPPDLTFPADAVAIANAAGGTGDVEENTSNNPCPVGVDFSPRKLVFIRKSGNSVSVPIANRTNLETAQDVIFGVLNQPGNEVVCVKLIGETWLSLNEELGLVYTANEVATDSRPLNGLKQYHHFGRIQYESDIFGGRAIFTPVKVATDIEGQPPTNVGAAWNTCVGPFEGANFACGSLKRNHRRYLLDFVVGNIDNTDPANPVVTNKRSERKEVPAKDYEAAQILACGTALAALQGAYCIGYQGESYDRVFTL